MATRMTSVILSLWVVRHADGNECVDAESNEYADHLGNLCRHYANNLRNCKHEDAKKAGEGGRTPCEACCACDGCPPPTCGDESYTCPKGSKAKPGDTVCHGGECSDDICCGPVVTCASHTCHRGNLPKSQGTTLFGITDTGPILCTDGTCTDELCCATSCANTVLSGNHQVYHCTGGEKQYTVKVQLQPGYENIFCPLTDAGCIEATCCCKGQCTDLQNELAQKDAAGHYAKDVVAVNEAHDANAAITINGAGVVAAVVAILT